MFESRADDVRAGEERGPMKLGLTRASSSPVGTTDGAGHDGSGRDAVSTPGPVDRTGVVVNATPLVVLAAVVEVLALARVLPVWAGATHEVALPPFDLVADLGVITSRASSIPVVVVGVVAAVTARSALLAWMLGQPRRWFRYALRFYLLVLAPALLAAQLVAAGQIILYALLLWAGVVVAVVTALALSAVPWRSPPRLRSSLLGCVRKGARVPTVLVYVLLLGGLGGIARLGGGAAELAAVAVSAALTFVVARRLARPGPRPRPYRIAGVTVVVALLAVALVRPGTGSRATPRAANRAGSLLLVAGIDTSSGHGTLFDLDPRTLGFSCAQTFYFSYRGPGPGTPQKQAVCPIRTGAPYGRADTQRSLPELEAAFRAQVAALPGPVTVVTHSSGSWIAWAALTNGTPTPVRRVVMLTPLVDPLGYPPRGHQGPGFVTGAAARLVAAIGRDIGFSTVRLDAPLPAELLASPATLSRLLGRPLPADVRALAVSASFDGPLLVGRHTSFPHATAACPSGAGHSGLVTDAATAAVIRTFLDGHAVPRCAVWWTWPGAFAAGFRLPGRVR